MLAEVRDKLAKIPFLNEFLNERTFEQFKKYFITGCLSFALEYSIFTLLFQVIRLWYITANTIAYIIIFWFNFLLNRYWSFKSRENIKKQLVLYGCLFFINIFATNGLMYLLSDMAGIPPQISKVLIMGAVVSWNFVIYKKIIYR
ncbi:MAG TPA: GtrA family protein [Clostridiaceae bacterium]|nr:GtrA family protein [Clostridiaceae bacterium]